MKKLLFVLVVSLLPLMAMLSLISLSVLERDS